MKLAELFRPKQEKSKQKIRLAYLNYDVAEVVVPKKFRKEERDVRLLFTFKINDDFLESRKSEWDMVRFGVDVVVGALVGPHFQSKGFEKESDYEGDYEENIYTAAQELGVSVSELQEAEEVATDAFLKQFQEKKTV